MRRFIALFAVLTILSLAILSCERADETVGEKNGDGNFADPVDISTLDLSLYIELGEYKGLEISLGADSSKGDAVWQRVQDGATVIAYPEGQVRYYFERSKASYEYLAARGNDTYENILEGLGVTEEQMIEDARALTRSDLVLHAVIKAEGIVLTDDDKRNNFERYVMKFVVDYGYSEEYVRSNMTEQIYDTMLFDKTVELLITLNTFVEQ